MLKRAHARWKPPSSLLFHVRKAPFTYPPHTVSRRMAARGSGVACWECGEFLNRDARKDGGLKTGRMGRTEETDREVGVVRVESLATCVKAWKSLRFFQAVGYCLSSHSPCLFDCDLSLTYTSLFYVRPFSSTCYTATYLYKGIKGFLATMYITRLANEAGVLDFLLGGLQLIMFGLGTFTRHLYIVCGRTSLSAGLG